jgi:7,8-dihydro-6-hydroxymethylpterin-pyrophosphokinase
VERELGRRRNEKWGPRCIDLDILYYANELVSRTDLIIPHPELHTRDFVLRPLTDILPGYRHPVLEKSNKELLEELEFSINLPEYHIFAPSCF